jgi:hypothetical protein
MYNMKHCMGKTQGCKYQQIELIPGNKMLTPCNPITRMPKISIILIKLHQRYQITLMMVKKNKTSSSNLK